MNKNHAIQTAGRIGSFCARHLLGSIVTVAGACLIWTITYIILLLWAVFTGNGLGGPLAYPAGLLFFFVAGTAASLILLLPSTALAEGLARRHRFPIFAQIPLSVASLALLCLLIVGAISASGSRPTLQNASIGFGVLFLAHLIPLGIYWWAVQSGPLFFLLFQRIRSIFHS